MYTIPTYQKPKTPRYLVEVSSGPDEWISWDGIKDIPSKDDPPVLLSKAGAKRVIKIATRHGLSFRLVDTFNDNKLIEGFVLWMFCQ